MTSLSLAEKPPDKNTIEAKLASEKFHEKRNKLKSNKAIAAQETFFPKQAKPTSSEIKQTKKVASKFTTFIIGLNVGNRNVNPGILVRGEVTDKEAIDLEKWLIPYDAVLQAFKFTPKVLAENEVELRSSFKITRINLNQISTDPELGLVLSVKEIKDIFGIETKFDRREYALVFDVPEVKNPENNDREKKPVLLTGLPKIPAPNVTLSSVEQRLNLSGTNSSALTSQGSLSAVGTLFDSSWFVRLNQSNLTERPTWQLSELQILK